jgi:integrase
VPAERTKTGKRKKSSEPHVVPLSARAVAIVEAQLAVAKDPAGFVFTGEISGGQMGKNQMKQIMEKLCGVGPVPHGLRSTFRDWCGENNHPREHAELALSHAFGDKTERSYRRSKMVEQRRAVMDAWAEFCGGG